MTCPADSILMSRAPLGSGCPETSSQTPANGLFFVSLPVVCDQARATAASVIGNAISIFMMSSFFYGCLSCLFVYLQNAFAAHGIADRIGHHPTADYRVGGTSRCPCALVPSRQLVC